MGSGFTSPAWPGPPQPIAGRRRRGRAHVWLRLLLVLVIVWFVCYVALNPWALRIGGRFNLLETWDGYGQVTGSNGGRYLLFTHLNGTIFDRGGDVACDFTGCDNVRGSGQLCTEGGATYSFALTGDVHSWWSTNGARTDIDLSDSPPLPDGWVVAFRGAWQGPVLRLADTDNSFTEVFTPAGRIRHTTSTADAGTAQVVVKPGSANDFARACRALAAGRR